VGLGKAVAATLIGDVLDFARPRVYQTDKTSAGGGTDDIVLQPTIGHLWRVLAAYAYHDDAGNTRSLRWSLVEPTIGNTFTLEARTIGALEFQWLNTCDGDHLSSPAFLGPITIGSGNYLNINALALGAGKKLYAVLYFMRLDG